MTHETKVGHEKGPDRRRLHDRPDNGSRSSRGSGPSSGVRKDNPHKPLRIARHADAA
jgi:hypothetical protein